MHFNLSETKLIILFINFLIYHSESRKMEDKRRLTMSSKKKKRRNLQIQADRISLTNDENVVAIHIDVFFPSADCNHERDSIER